MDFVSGTGFRGSFTFSCLLTLDLDYIRFIQVDFVADGEFLLIIHIGFRKFWWISWISIFRPTGAVRAIWLGSVLPGAVRSGAVNSHTAF